jgi:hypothetical protein
MNVLPSKKIINKPSATIHISGHLKLAERKFWNHLFFNAQSSIFDESIHEYSLKRAKDHFKTRNQAYIENILKSLKRTEVEMNIFDKDKKTEWTISSLIADAQIKNGTIRYSFGPIFLEKLKHSELNYYTKIDVLLSDKFKTKYGLALWELCTDYKNIGHTVWMDYNKVIQWLAINPKTFKSISAINKKYLVPAVKEVNKFSAGTLKVSQEQDKKGTRTILAIRYLIYHEMEVLLPNERKGNVNEMMWNILNNEFGLRKDLCLSILNKYPEAYIMDHITYTRLQNKKVTIKSIAGYFLKALDNNYASSNNSSSDMN